MSATEREFKGTKIIVVAGDITKLEVDAIVNPANSQLIMGGGVAGAILRAGGREIQEEAFKKAPIQVGQAVVTTAGKLKAKYVIHAPTMTRPAMATSLNNVKAATEAALRCARQAGAQSLAFPGLGTGVGGLDLQAAASVMVETVKKAIETDTLIKSIIFVGYNSDMIRAFQKGLLVIE
jgi:O-acetyl-ADP-ribose deacetylase (regulator of RNase III)